MNATYRKQTYDLKEVLTDLTYGQDGDFTSKLDYQVGQTWLNHSLLEIMEVYTDQGRCYSIYTSDFVAVKKAIRLELKIQRYTI